MGLTRPLGALLVALYCCGCWGADDDAAPSHDASSDPAFPTDFVYENRGPDPVVIGGSCGETWPSLTQDGDPLAIQGGCACACSDFHTPDGCPACPDICLNTAELVVPGVPHTTSWDGLAFNYTRPECYTLQAPAQGTELTAWVCHDVDASDDPQCVETDFEYGVEQEVLLRATPEPQPPVRQLIQIENQTGVPIDIVVDRCGSQGWFQLAEKDPRIVMNMFCACACNDAFEVEACPDCGACNAEQSLTLAVGESHSFEWDGRFWYQYESECARNYAMPQSYAPLVKVCYSKLGDGDESLTCTVPQPLAVGEGLVETFAVTE